MCDFSCLPAIDAASSLSGAWDMEVLNHYDA